MAAPQEVQTKKKVSPEEIPSLKDVLFEQGKPTAGEKKEVPSLRDVLFGQRKPLQPEPTPKPAPIPQEKAPEIKELGFFEGIAQAPKEFGKGIIRGIDETQAMLFGALALIGDALNAENIRKFGTRGYLRNIEEAQKNAAKVATLADIDSVGDFVAWAASGLGGVIPTIATSLGSGTLAQAIGKTAVKRALKRKIGEEVAESLMKKVAEGQLKRLGKKELEKEAAEALVKRGIAKEVAERTVKRAIKQPITARNIGLLVGSATPQAGDIYMEIFETTGERAPGVATLAGLGAGFLDVIPLQRFFNKFGGTFKTDEAARRWVTRAAKEAGLQGVLEGITEGAQEIIAIVANSIKKHPGSFEEKLPKVVEDLKKQKERVLNAAAIGALAGFTMGGIEAASQRAEPKQEAAPTAEPTTEVTPEEAAIERALREQKAVEAGVLMPQQELEAVRQQIEGLPEEEIAARQREELRKRLEFEQQLPSLEAAGVPVEEGIPEEQIPFEELVAPRLPEDVLAKVTELRGKITRIEAKQEKAFDNQKLTEKERVGIIQELDGRIKQLENKIKELVQPYVAETELPEPETRPLSPQDITPELIIEAPSLAEVLKQPVRTELQQAGDILKEIEGGREEVERAKVPSLKPRNGKARARTLPAKEVRALPAPKEEVKGKAKKEEPVYIPEKKRLNDAQFETELREAFEARSIKRLKTLLAQATSKQRKKFGSIIEPALKIVEKHEAKKRRPGSFATWVKKYERVRGLLEDRIATLYLHFFDPARSEKLTEEELQKVLKSARILMPRFERLAKQGIEDFDLQDYEIILPSDILKGDLESGFVKKKGNKFEATNIETGVTKEFNSEKDALDFVLKVRISSTPKQKVKGKAKAQAKPKTLAPNLKEFGIKVEKAEIERIGKAVGQLLSRLKKLRSQIADEQGNLLPNVPKDLVQRYINLEKAIELRLKRLNTEFDAAKVNGFVKKTPEGWLATSLYSREQMIFDNIEDAIAFTRGEAKVDPTKVNYKEFERASAIVDEAVKEAGKKDIKELAPFVQEKLKKAGIHPFIVRRMVSAVIRRPKPEETGREVIFKRAVEPKTKKEETAANRLAQLNHLRRQAEADYNLARKELLDIILETENAEFLEVEDIATYKFKRMEGLDKVPEGIRQKVRLALIDYIAEQGVEVLPAVGRRLEIAVTPKVEPKGKPLPKSIKAKFVETAKRFERYKKLDEAEKKLKQSPKIKEIFHNAYLQAFASGQVYPPIRTPFGAFIVRQSQTNLDRIEQLKAKRSKLTKEILKKEGAELEKGDPYITIRKVKRVPKSIIPKKATPKQIKEIADAIATTEKEIEKIVNFSIANTPESRTRKAKKLEPIAKDFEKKFGLKVKIVKTPKDLPFNAPPTTQGAAVGDHVFLVEQNIPDAKVARQTLLEEAVGHIGIEKLMGKDFDRLLDRIIKERPDEINRYIVEYDPVLRIKDIDPKSRAAKRLAAQEVIAKLAREEPNLSLTKRIIAEVRAWLRKVFPNIKFTDNDIRALLMRAADNLRHQNADPYKTTPRIHVDPRSEHYDIANFKPVNTNSPSFRKWFKGSKIVDEKGSPRVVYHGTTADFTSFEPTRRLFAAIDQFLGIHFAKDYRVANRFAEGLYRGKKDGGNVIPVYLNLNPKVIETKLSDTIEIARDIVDVAMTKRKDLFIEWALERFSGNLDRREAGILFDWLTNKRKTLPKEIEEKFDRVYGNDLYIRPDDKSKGKKTLAQFVTEFSPALTIKERNSKQRLELIKTYKEELAKQGYNGIEYRITVEDEVPKGADATAYIVFEPTQIKSAISNTGEFDPNIPDIRYAVGNFVNPMYNPDLFLKQDREAEKLSKSMTNRQIGFYLEAAGDIYRELVGRDIPSETYLREKLNRLKDAIRFAEKDKDYSRLSAKDRKLANQLISWHRENAKHPTLGLIASFIDSFVNGRPLPAETDLTKLERDIEWLLDDIEKSRRVPNVNFSLRTLSDEAFTKLATLGHKLYRQGTDFDTWNKRMAMALGNNYNMLEPFMQDVFDIITRSDYKPGMRVSMRATESKASPGSPPEPLPANPTPPTTQPTFASPIRRKRQNAIVRITDTIFETMVNVVGKQNPAGEEFSRRLKKAIGIMDELVGRSANLIVETQKALRNPLRTEVREAIDELIATEKPIVHEPRAIYTRAAMAVNELAERPLHEVEQNFRTEGARLWLRTYNQILENMGVEKGYVNVLTPEIREILNIGEGDRYQRVVEIIRNVAGLSQKEVKSLLSRVNRREGVISGRLVNMPTHIEIEPGEIIPFLESHPFGSLEAANVGLAKQIALASAFGEGDTVSDRIKSAVETIERLQTEYEIQGGNSKYFNDALNAYLGKPLAQVHVDPRSLGKRFLKNVLMPIESEMLLSLSGFVQIPQTIIAVPSNVGAKNFIKGIAKFVANSKETIERLRYIGAISTDIIDLWMTPGALLEDFGKAIKQVSSRLSLRKWFIEMNDIIAASAFEEFAKTIEEKVESGQPLSENDKKTLRFLEFKDDEIQMFESGHPDTKEGGFLFNELIRRGRKITQGTGLRGPEKTRALASPVFNLIFQFQHYMVLQTQIARKFFVRDLRRAIREWRETGNAATVMQSLKRAGALMVGGALAGEMSIFLRSILKDRPLDRDDEELMERLKRDFGEALVFGPVQRVLDAYEFSNSTEQFLFNFSPFASFTLDVGKALIGQSPYNDATMVERIAKFIKYHTPITASVKAALVAIGLESKKDKELRDALTRLYKWKRKNGFIEKGKTSSLIGYLESRREVKKAIEAIRKGMSPREALNSAIRSKYKELIEKAKKRQISPDKATIEEAKRRVIASLRARLPLRGIPMEKLPQLRDDIGVDNFRTIYAYNELLKAYMDVLK